MSVAGETLLPGTHHKGLLRHSALLLIATQLGTLCNIGFQMVMGRALPPQEYSILAALLSLALIFSAPVQGLRTMAAHFSARWIQSGKEQELRGLLRHWIRRTTLWSALSLAAIYLATPWVSRFLNLDEPAAVLIMGLAIALGFLSTLLAGTLQGVQSFRWLAVTNLSWPLVRLGCGFLLVVVATPLGTPRATHGLAAQVAASIATIVLVGLVLNRSLDATQTTAVLPETRPYLLHSCIVFACFATLMYGSIVLVRHFLPEQAGPFAYAATIGRSVIFLPMPVSMALFPKVASSGGMTRFDFESLLRGVLYGSCLLILAAGVCMLLPELALSVLYGISNPDPGQIRLVRMVVLAMSPLGLGYLLMNFELAQGRLTMVSWSLLLAVLHVTGIYFWHDTVWQITAVMAAANGCYLLMLWLLLPRHSHRIRDPEMDTTS